MMEESKKLFKTVKILKKVDDDTQIAMINEVQNICAKALTKVGRVVAEEHIGHKGVGKIVNGLLDLTDDIVDEFTTDGSRRLKKADVIEKSALIDISNAPKSPEVIKALEQIDSIKNTKPIETEEVAVKSENSDLQAVKISPTKVG